MTRLYLLRHGLAVPHGTEGIAEDERPLTEKGEKRIRQVARGLKRLKLKVDRIVTSPLPRASRTAEIVANSLDLAYLLEEADVLRPDSTPEAIGEWLKTRVEGRILLVGHNPNLSLLLSLLTTGSSSPTVVELRKGGVAALRETPAGRQFQLEWITRPRLIRRFAD